MFGRGGDELGGAALQRQPRAHLCVVVWRRVCWLRRQVLRKIQGLRRGQPAVLGHTNVHSMCCAGSCGSITALQGRPCMPGIRPAAAPHRCQPVLPARRQVLANQPRCVRCERQVIHAAAQRGQRGVSDALHTELGQG
jgi:hypothetical protein